MDSDIKPSLDILRRQYLQLVQPSQLRWPEGAVLKRPAVQSWIFDNFFDVDQISTLPPRRYQMRILKVLVSKIEESISDPEEDEISDNLMSALSELLSANVPSETLSAQQKAYVTYIFPFHHPNTGVSGDRAVTLLESRSVISSFGTTGLRTWEAALHLGAFLASEDGQAIVRGKRIFELGAGTGMLSIFCAKYLGVSDVVATDGDEAVVDAIKTNIFLNGLDDPSQTAVRTTALKWGWPVNAATFAEDYGMDAPHVVIGADVTYDKFAIPALVSSLREFFDLNPVLQVLVAATIRNEQTFETFLKACKRNGFSLDLIDFPTVPEHIQDGPFYPTSTPIKIWRITRSQARDLFAF